MEYGDHIVSDRLGYSHHGIYVGNGQVIHYAGFARGLSKGKIEITDLEDFCQNQGCYVKTHILPVYDRDEVFERALSRINEDSYNLVFNNCEHFVTWCIYGIRSSSQVNGLVFNAVATNIFVKRYIATTGLPYLITAGKVTGLPLIQVPFLLKASSAPLLASAFGGGSTIAVTSTSMLIGGSGAAMMSGTTASILGGAAAGAGVAAVGVGAGTAAAGVGVAGLAAVGGVALAPALGIMAAGAGLGYGAKKLFDWIWD